MSSLQYWISRTMIIERGTGVIVYALALLYFYLRLRKAKGYISLKRTLNTYIAVLCVLAYFYIPAETADLFRLWELADAWSDYSLAEFFERRFLHSATPISHLIMYMCGKTGNLRTLPTLCAFIFYVNVFFILKDQYRRHSVSTIALSTSLLMLMSSGIFMLVISNIRNFTGLSILARCFYDEMYNKKPITKNLVFEIIAALMHQMCLVILVVRIFLALFQSANTKLKQFFNVVLVLLVALFAYIFGQDYIAVAFAKAGSYVRGAVTGADNYFFVWGYLITMILVIQYILILRVYRKKTLPYNLRTVHRFNIILLAIVILVFFEYSICHRTSMFIMMTIIPLCMEIEKGAYKCSPLLYRHINYLSLLMLVISCTRGDLCGYKFFLLN